MEGDVRKRNSKFLFVDEEEGQITDSEPEDDAQEVKRKRDDEFISEWAAKVQKQKEVEEPKSEMDLVSEDEDSQIDVKPIAMTITFRDESFARKHRGVIETQMVMKFGPNSVDSNENCIFVYPCKASTDILQSVVAPLGALTVQFHDEAFCKEFHNYMLNLCKELFGSSKVTSDAWCIEVVQNDLLDFEVDTNRFGRESNMMYHMPERGMIQEPKPKGGRPGNCFNCGGDHNLNNCDRPRNYEVINRNREKMKQNRIAMNKRYHAEIDNFSEFLPGSISPDLRKALGLAPNQLPPHIYEMRKFGYPPGWLLEAKVAHSGVSVYGFNGVVPEDGDEEGEVFEEGEKDQYDIKKLIRYPGFNCSAPEDTKEEPDADSQFIPMNESHDLEKMIAKLAPNAYKAYQKRKSIQVQRQDSEGADSGINSPQVLSKSCASSQSNTPTETDSEKSLLIPPKCATPEPSPSNSMDPEELPATPKMASAAIVDLGTPVLPSASPFAKLPSRDKFGVNISDVLNFENLPNATGTYEKVFGSISKIREFNSQRI